MIDRNDSTRPDFPDLAPLEIAEAVQSACIQTIMAAYEDAGLQGVCEEGRWEAAVGALRSLDLDGILKGLDRSA
jgi:hypothetical protein